MEMDRPSVAFARFLDSAQVIEEVGTARVLLLTCSLCSESICDIEEGDTLRVLLNTALAHDCP
jgi:hypothetical protein